MPIKFFFFLLISLFLNGQLAAQNPATGRLEVTFISAPNTFPLVHAGKAATILVDPQEAEVVRMAAKAFSEDVARVTGKTPVVSTTANFANISGMPVIIGTQGQSALLDQLASRPELQLSRIQGQWESYVLAVVENPTPNIKQALVIAGSDRRGTAYGVFELSKQIGVSPWYWWADAVPQHRDNLYVRAGIQVQGPPSVKYRGIFLNDEDWGLQPWAAQKMDTDIKDIGPKTYARIFELLLRLKANLIWPAMHPSTKAFFSYPGNPQVANAYAIVVGTSHAEPMLRNNVDEWHEKTMGDFNYFNNQQGVFKYWENRVREAGSLEAIYSMGMRGVHDSGMKGAKNITEAARMIEKILGDQRGLLQKYGQKPVSGIPQVFTAYKEVLDIYDQGLKLPEDITLVWPDDNYGYIHRLSNPQEQGRSGGSGVYYHASYWGRPHDYLWLSSTNPHLIRAEMMKAYHLQARDLWVLNVGDIKPLEHNIDLFLAMAYNAPAFDAANAVEQHLQNWAAGIFGAGTALKIVPILSQYYQLAFERRPEFMGWSQTEPTTQTKYSTYNHFYYGDEAQRRLNQYEALEQQVKALRPGIAAQDADAFYQLVYYPVMGASLMNKKFLYRDKSFLYAQQNRSSARDYALMAKQAYEEIVKETEYFNRQLAGGKWQGMMSMKPRDLPVYKDPVLPVMAMDSTGIWGVSPEGTKGTIGAAENLVLPAFHATLAQAYFVDLFLTGNQAVAWRAKTSSKWIRVFPTKGLLSNTFKRKDQRLWVSIDWKKIPKKEILFGHITFKGGGKTFTLPIKALNPGDPQIKSFSGFMENNGYVSIYAESFSKKIDRGPYSWVPDNYLGHGGTSLVAMPLQGALTPDSASLVQKTAYLEYDFYSLTEAAPTIAVSTLPTHPVTSKNKLRYGVSIDEGPIQVVNFQTFGRSEEWKQNVLQNRAVRQVKFPLLAKGAHRLQIYLLDPGVVLDRITIDLGGLQPAYSPVPETRKL